MATIPMTGGAPVSAKIIEEVHVMSGHVVLVFLVLVCAYTSRIPNTILDKFKTSAYKFGSLFLIILLTSMYGWIHGIIASLAFALVISRAYRHTEGFSTYEPDTYTDDITFVDNSHKWLIESILGETPKVIRDREVNTTAVQDMSEKNMGISRSSR